MRKNEGREKRSYYNKKSFGLDYNRASKKGEK